MSHVLYDNDAPENCGGRRKFGEMEDIALLKHIVENDSHVCRRGKVTENFEEVARAFNEILYTGKVLQFNLLAKTT
jgi:hypothetical protein